MSLILRLFVALAGIFLIVVVLRDVVRKKLQERQSLFWIFSGLLFILVAIFPPIVQLVSDIFKVEYAPSIILALAALVCFWGLFRCYRTNCELERQVSELARLTSILNEKINRRDGE